jgi:hypothetical protein
VTGRIIICWKTYRERDKFKQIFIVKDSWQYPKREEKGELLRETTEKGIVNVARYYYYKTVHVGGSEDDVNGNVRKGLNITKASNAFRIISANKIESKILSLNTSKTSIESLQRSRNKSITRKRSSSSFNALLPSSKRICSSLLYKQKKNQIKLNRVRRRVILRDYGKGIYKINSRVAILAALEDHITDKKCK